MPLPADFSRGICPQNAQSKVGICPEWSSVCAFGCIGGLSADARRPAWADSVTKVRRGGCGVIAGGSTESLRAARACAARADIVITTTAKTPVPTPPALP